MARDLLCIPIAGVGVERAFNYARDMCHYRRGQMKPETLRAEMLVFYSQLSESRLSKLQEQLSCVLDTRDMTEEEMETEIQQQEAEINLRNDKIDSWDMDSYISDEESSPGISARTRKQQLKREYIERKRKRRNHSSSYTQVLSSCDRAVQARLEDDRQRREEAEDQADQDNPRRWSVPLEEDEGRDQDREEDDIEDANLNENGEEVTLPQVRQRPNVSSQGRLVIEIAKRRRLNK